MTRERALPVLTNPTREARARGAGDGRLRAVTTRACDVADGTARIVASPRARASPRGGRTEVRCHEIWRQSYGYPGGIHLFLFASWSVNPGIGRTRVPKFFEYAYCKPSSGVLSEILSRACRSISVATRGGARRLPATMARGDATARDYPKLQNGSSTRGLEDADPETREAVLALRGDWKFYAVFSFCHTFRAVMRLPAFTADRLERALLDPTREVVVIELILRLIEDGSRTVRLEVNDWERRLKRRVRQIAHETDCRGCVPGSRDGERRGRRGRGGRKSEGRRGDPERSSSTRGNEGRGRGDRPRGRRRGLCRRPRRRRVRSDRRRAAPARLPPSRPKHVFQSRAIRAPGRAQRAVRTLPRVRRGVRGRGGGDGGGARRRRRGRGTSGTEAGRRSVGADAESRVLRRRGGGQAVAPGPARGRGRRRAP